MSDLGPEISGDIPDPQEQIAGLTFGLMLLAPDLTISEVNPAAENLIGRSARRLIGLNLLEVCDFGQTRIAEKLAADDEGQLVARDVSVRMDERSMTMNVTVSAIPARQGWRVVTLTDAGQGEKFGEEERAANVRGPAILAHEIKNPLSAIKGAAQLVARKLPEGERGLTDLIDDEVDRIAKLIDRMQRLGQEQPEPVGPVNLHAAIRRALDTIDAASAVKIRLREEFDPSLPLVLANEGALIQVLINLISNARDACAQHPSPEIAIRTRFVSGLVYNVIRLGRPVKLPIEVRISDNGPGIDPALRNHIFEPFVSSKTNGQGLGLALVHKLIRDMDGRIGHDRDDSAGLTHFWLHLPMAK